MEKLELVIGNKAYSSWSLRPWLVLKEVGAEFVETRVPLYVHGYKEELLKHAPSGKVPILKHGAVTVWDSLAICEYLAELFPQAGLWPKDQAIRAAARAVSAEMHSGFSGIRSAMPFNCRARGRHVAISAEVQKEIERVLSVWRDCRRQYGKGGPWLFGRFSIADAMFIPVAGRFVTYSVPLDAVAQSYVDAALGHPAVREWTAAAMQETEVMISNEVGQ
ncbi:MAG TPA: glutathione S-transferase family protein [Gammaproteobacteria bacterium]|nr:glutathione S-transferase family protein [Gammaproteobacteria bacterium]